MAKDKNYEGDINRADLIAQRKILEKKLKQVNIPCSHTNSKGKLKVEFIRGSLAECKKCGLKFDFDTIQLEDLDSAIRVLHNAINQVKAFSNDPEGERKIIRMLGEMDYNMYELRELYKRANEEFGKNNKRKKRNNNDSFGSYGINSLSMTGGKKRR